MIKFIFDEDKVSPREAQIIHALLRVHYDSLTFMYQGADRPADVKRKTLEGYAERVRKVMTPKLPDLSIRWEWRDPPQDPPPVE